jgi:hypothetical protein
MKIDWSREKEKEKKRILWNPMRNESTDNEDIKKGAEEKSDLKDTQK